MRRVTILFTALLFAMSMLATPAAAHHDHNLINPSGCVDIRVGHQDHSGYDDAQDGDPRGVGKMFHGGAHVGAATEEVEGEHTLGQGNSPVWVDGGSCEPK